MSKETLTTPCAICGATLPLDGVATIALGPGRYACRSCVAEASQEELRRLKAPASSVVAPSPATREMLKALVDRLMFTAPTAAELVAHAVRRSLDALIAGDYGAFCREQFTLADALDSVARAFEAAASTEAAIQSLDPALFAYARDACLEAATNSYRRTLTGRAIPDLLVEYGRHMISCTHGGKCPEILGLSAELLSRGVKVQR